MDGKTAGLIGAAIGVLAAIGRGIAWIVGWGMKPYDTRLENVELSCAQSAKKEDVFRVEKTVIGIGEDVSRIFQSIETSRIQMFERFDTEGKRIGGLNAKIARLEGRAEAEDK